jgi:hypothetical protein
MDRLTTADVADMIGITPAAFRSYWRKGYFPPPDGRLGATPWWERETVTAWLEERRP